MASFANYNPETNIQPQAYRNDYFSLAQCSTPNTVYCPEGYKASRCNMSDVFAEN